MVGARWVRSSVKVPVENLMVQCFSHTEKDEEGRLNPYGRTQVTTVCEERVKHERDMRKALWSLEHSAVQSL